MEITAAEVISEGRHETPKTPIFGLVLKLRHFALFIPGSTLMIYKFPTDGLQMDPFMRTGE